MRVTTAALALVALALTLPASRAAELDIRYPAKVTTMQGRIFHLQDLGHDLARGSFVMHDGETEGRVPWRDIDRITFTHNLGHRPGAIGPTKAGTQRVELRYVDGTTRIVNIVIAGVRGFDGISSREISPDDIAVIDFDSIRIAPALYRTCSRGHVWEQADYKFCPYDGTELASHRVDGKR